jgi:hypothetical protein
MDLLFWIHLLLTFTLITIPFWPIKYLEYGVYIPLILSIIWIFFNGCPFTRFHKIDSSSFSQDILRFFIPDVSDKLTEHVNTFILLIITVSGFYRLRNA